MPPICVHDLTLPPPSEVAAQIRELTERLNAAADKAYVWPPSLINKFVLCLKANRRARELLKALVGGL